ncbi:MAG: NAD(P)H-dependent oxidoreductase [Microbacteriaceae bacterium]
MQKLKIAIIIGSTRPGRKGKSVGDWVFKQAQQRDDAEFTLIDLADEALPFLDEQHIPSANKYSHEHTLAWAAKIAPFDGYLIITPEYNHAANAALKNALDMLYREWNDKVAAFVGYGSWGGARAIESLRLNCSALKMAVVSNQVGIITATEFEGNQFIPSERQERALDGTIKELLRWGGAFKTLRN